MQVRGRDDGYVGPLRSGHKASTGGQSNSSSCSVALWGGHARWNLAAVLRNDTVPEYGAVPALTFPDFLRSMVESTSYGISGSTALLCN